MENFAIQNAKKRWLRFAYFADGGAVKAYWTGRLEDCARYTLEEAGIVYRKLLSAGHEGIQTVDVAKKAQAKVKAFTSRGV